MGATLITVRRTGEILVAVFVGQGRQEQRRNASALVKSNWSSFPGVLSSWMLLDKQRLFLALRSRSLTDHTKIN
jgi:hypothetical protein